MYQENIVAAGELDAHLFEVLRHSKVDGTRVDGEVPLVALDFLDRLPGLDDAQAAALWCEMADVLAGLNFVYSAWMAYQQAAARCPQALARGEVISRRADMLDRHGYGMRASCDRRLAARLRGQPFPAGRIVELEDDGLAVVSCQGDRDEFARLSASFVSPLRNDPMRDPATVKPGFHAVRVDRFGLPVDLSFLVVDSEYRPIVQVECDALGDDVLACRNTSIELTPLCEAGYRAFPLALRQLEMNAQWIGAAEIMLQAWDDDPNETVLAWASRRRAVVIPMRYATIRLDRPLADILADFRQTHRNLARWGLSNLTFQSSFTHPPLDLIRSYRHLVTQEGRMLLETEAETLARLERGEISLHAALRQGVRETVVSVSYCGDVAYYSGAVRSHDQVKSSAQGLIYQIVAELRERGIRELILGDLLEGTGFDPKLRSIAAFKAGFTKSFRSGKWVRVHSGIAPSILDVSS
ncbi:MAG: hypothetical protein LDL39_02860 [Magnetospirillum sp.]|nr:hypothetical protein [Magnetospirillum sp.]